MWKINKDIATTIHTLLQQSGAYKNMTDGQILDLIKKGRPTNMQPMQQMLTPNNGKGHISINVDGIQLKSYDGSIIYKVDGKYKIEGYDNEYLVVQNGKLKLINTMNSTFDTEICSCNNSSIYVFQNKKSLMIVVYSGTMITTNILLEENIKSHTINSCDNFSGKPKFISSSYLNLAFDYSSHVSVVDIYIKHAENMIESMDHKASHNNIKFYKPNEYYKNRKDFVFYKTNDDFIFLGTTEFYDNKYEGFYSCLTKRCAVFLLGECINTICDEYLEELNKMVEEHLIENENKYRAGQLGN